MSTTQANTLKRYAQDTIAGFRTLAANWGQRFIAGAMSIVGDGILEGAQQAFYARLPGHPQQAPDSLQQVALDRGLVRFRGETAANFLQRVQSAWDDYEQEGTALQMLRVLNQWGNAGWPSTWVNLTTINETTHVTAATPFVFEVVIPFGNIFPPWVPALYGGSDVYGEPGFYYGTSQSSDIPVLLYLVRKWKPSRSKGLVTVFWGSGPSNFVTFVV